MEQAKIKVIKESGEDTIFTRQISISDLVFFVGPRINAAGRINTGRESVKLLICDDEDKSKGLGENINNHNDTRRELDKKATEEAINMILTEEEFKDKRSVVIYNPGWNKGIIGIVASRLVEEFYKPIIVITDSPEGLITGSARSIKEFNIYDGIDYCADLLEHFGGHKFAAGLSLKKENLDKFKQKFEEYVVANIQDEPLTPELIVDIELDLSEINSNFVNNLKKFAPYGPENMAPVFLSRHVIEEGNARIVGDKHLKMRVSYRNKSVQPIDVIAFNQVIYYEQIRNRNDFDMVYHVEENTWNNVTNIQLNVKDIKIND